MGKHICFLLLTYTISYRKYFIDISNINHTFILFSTVKSKTQLHYCSLQLPSCFRIYCICGDNDWCHHHHHYFHLSANENFTFGTTLYNHIVLVIFSFSTFFILHNQNSKDKCHIWTEEKMIDDFKEKFTAE